MKASEHLDLKKRREDVAVSPEVAGEAIGVSGRTVRRWEAGDNAPNQAQLAALLNFYRRIAAGIGRELVKLGICCEFIDTSFPIICADPYRTFEAEPSLPPVELVAVPWDDRCLRALNSGLVDVVLYNEARTLRYQDQHPAMFLEDERPYESGSFYIAVRPPAKVPRSPAAFGAAPEAALDLLKELLRSENLLIMLPPADMELAFRRTVDRLAMTHDVPTFDQLQGQCCYGAPGALLRRIFDAPDKYLQRPIIYCGGQDQRELLWMCEEELLGEEERFVVIEGATLETTLGDGVYWKALKTNRFYARDRSASLHIPKISDCLDRAFETLVQAEDVGAEQRRVWQPIIRWHDLYNTFMSEPVTGVPRDRLFTVFEGVASRDDGSPTAKRFNPLHSDGARQNNARLHT